MATAAAPETTMATSVMTTKVPTRARPVFGSWAGSIPRAWRAKSDANTPIMKISEWAKLISRRTP